MSSTVKVIPTSAQIAAYLRGLERAELRAVLLAAQDLERAEFVTRHGRTISRYPNVRCPWCKFVPNVDENAESSIGLHNHQIEHWTCENCSRNYSIETYDLLVVEREA